MISAGLKQLILSAADQRILCLGDVMLDDYIYGHVTRISPEAPVPVLQQTRTEQMPGGAANVARNLASLGARTRLISMIGGDETGQTLKALLQQTEYVDAHLFVDESSITTRKTRLVSGGQQLLRLDQDTSGLGDQADMEDIFEVIAEAADGATAILISDYAKGLVTPDLINAVLKAGIAHSIPIIVDPKGNDIARYGPVDLLKPNAAELSAMVEMPTQSDEEIEAALEMALELSAVKALLVTRAAQGLSYLKRGENVQHCRGIKRNVYDVSGAGDTVLAALGLALSAKADLDSGAQFALMASGLAVEKLGTATLTQAELLSRDAGKLRSLDDLLNQVQTWRKAGQSVGFTNGCFDILHPGHLRVLEEAKARCGRLVVGLNSDASVKRLKGETRPVNGEQARAQLLSGLSVVDAVILFEEETPADLIESLKPDLLVKGGDYTEDSIVGAQTVKAGGGKVHIVPLLDGFSTTQTIAKTQTPI